MNIFTGIKYYVGLVILLCFLPGCNTEYWGAESRLKRDELLCEYLELEIQHRKTCNQCHGTMHFVIDDGKKNQYYTHKPHQG